MPQDASRASTLTFLQLEIGIANTMLDAAATTRDEATAERRRVRADEACLVVQHYLDDASKSAGFTVSERTELFTGLQALRTRMAALGPMDSEPGPG
jgi:hypothetical protein